MFTDPDRTPDPVALARQLPRGTGLVYRAFGAPDRALFARAAWTREYGLVRRVDGEKFATLHESNPEIKAVWEKVKADYPDISPRNQRLLTILRSPAHNILVAMPGGWSPESIKPSSFTEIDGWNVTVLPSTISVPSGDSPVVVRIETLPFVTEPV